jgi:hypothetical protein
VEQYVRALIDYKDYPEVAYKQCLGIIALAKTFTPQRLNKACELSLNHSRLGYHIIRNILHNEMDLQEPQADQTTTEIEEHANIRGADYFQ